MVQRKPLLQHTLEPVRGVFLHESEFPWRTVVSRIREIFVLDEFARTRSLEKAFHAELDTLAIDLSGFSAQLDRHGAGLFVPSSEPHGVVASLVCWNTQTALPDLCEYFVAQGGAKPEMNALSDYLHDAPTRVFSFSTEQIWDKARWPYVANTVPPQSGIVDSASL